MDENYPYGLKYLAFNFLQIQIKSSAWSYLIVPHSMCHVQILIVFLMMNLMWISQSWVLSAMRLPFVSSNLI